jgi:hypothetical protein
MRIVAWILASCFATLWMGAACECRADADLTARLRKDAVPQWEALRAEILKLSGAVKEKIHVLARDSRPARESARDVRYWLRGPLYKYEARNVPDAGALTVYAKNSHDRFEITRDDRGSPLHVNVYSPMTQTRSRVDRVAKFYAAYPLTAFFVEGADLSDAIRKGRVDVKRLESKDSRGHAAATVIISNEENTKTEYEVEFLPDRGWVIAAWSVKDSDGEARANIEYFESVLGGRFPSSLSIQNLDKNGVAFASTECQFTEPKVCDAPEEAFTLAAYGLTPAGQIGPGDSAMSWRKTLLISNVLVVGALISFLWWRSYRGTSADN